jgi:hypothetical protein
MKENSKDEKSKFKVEMRRAPVAYDQGALLGNLVIWALAIRGEADQQPAAMKETKSR